MNDWDQDLKLGKVPKKMPDAPRFKPDIVERLRTLVIIDEVNSNNSLGRDAADQITALKSRVEELTKALTEVRQELWVNYCLQMGRTDIGTASFKSKPHIRIIDAALAMSLEGRGGAT